MKQAERNFDERKKLFWVRPGQFADWPYKTGSAVGVNLKDFWHSDGVFRVKYKDSIYEIPAARAPAHSAKKTTPLPPPPHLFLLLYNL